MTLAAPRPTPRIIPRIYLLGTDTGVGKTHLAAALLRAAGRRGLRALPFKPVQSGDDGPSDAQRLADAIHPDRRPDPDHIAPLRYDRPLAPGIAHRVTDFYLPRRPDPAPLRLALAHLEHLEHLQHPEFTLVEGAGGLHVPMPGGGWQLAWLHALADRVLVVGRLGLGTINHTLLTLDALRAAGIYPRGFALVDVDGAAQRDPSAPDNARVIAAASGIPALATVPHDPRPAHTAGWDATELLLDLLEPRPSPPPP